jgi:hypothetical protein
LDSPLDVAVTDLSTTACFVDRTSRAQARKSRLVGALLALSVSEMELSEPDEVDSARGDSPSPLKKFVVVFMKTSAELSQLSPIYLVR